MSNKIFTQNEINILTDNPYVKKVSAKSITYTDEFKRIFIAKHEEGNFPREIFEDHGFDINIVGIQRVESSGKRWRATYRKSGVGGLRDTRKENSGRPSGKELSTEEKYDRLKAQNNLLKAEIELLKKIHFLERGTGIRK
jgi:transposase